jgi:hypothetical protein
MLSVQTPSYSLLMVDFSKIRITTPYVLSVFCTYISSIVSTSQTKILWITLSLLFPKNMFKIASAGLMLCLFNLLLYVFLWSFSPKVNANKQMFSLFPGPSHGTQLQKPHHIQSMRLVSVFSRLINTQNRLCNPICCLFCPKLLQHVFIRSFSQNRRLDIDVFLFSGPLHEL